MSINNQSQDDNIPFCLKWIEGLNAPQKQAVLLTEGPLLVLAGAGTGKTRVLTARIASILETGRAKPWHIMAVTFTNRAAKEMQERLYHLRSNDPEPLAWMGTFHSIAAKILRRDADRVGLTSNFTIVDADDQERLLKMILVNHKVDIERWPVKRFVTQLEEWKNKGLYPVALPDSLPDKEGFLEKARHVYYAYQDRLLELNSVDFGDLVLLNVTLFQQYPDILKGYHHRFRYILVDEYQDTNTAQYLWLRLLSQGSQNICCVGDDDQSIYGWRGADVTNILRFEGDFKGAKVIRLEENYRSTGHILAAASGIIQHNQDRLGKTLWTQSEAGQKVEVHHVKDQSAEARLILNVAQKRLQQGLSLDNMAILVRNSAQMRAIEDVLFKNSVKYRIIGGLRFYERAEIRDMTAYLRLISQPADDLAMARILNNPKRGIGDTTVQVLQDHAWAHGKSLLQTLDDPEIRARLRPKTREALLAFKDLIERWIHHKALLSPVDLLRMILDESGYENALKNEDTLESQGRLDNLKELTRTISGFQNVQDYLDHVALVLEAETGEKKDPKLTIMTLHAAKGLEFQQVFLPGWEQDLFPSARALKEGNKVGLEEERRLAYVAITRARRYLMITHTQERWLYKGTSPSKPSCFLEELPPENVAVFPLKQSSSSGYGYGYSGSGGGNRSNTGGYTGSPHRKPYLSGL